MDASSLFFSAYSALWRVAQPLLRRHKRLAPAFEQRLAPVDWPGPAWAGVNTVPCLWIQAASGGEARLVQALIPALFEHLGPAKLLCTTCTRQGLDVLESLKAPPGVLLHPCYFPLDRPDIMDRALQKVAPHCVILLETELWPGLLHAAKKQGCPVLVLNGRMTAKSRKAYGLMPSLWRALSPDRVLAISQDDAGRFASLFNMGEAVEVMPNIKFDLAASLAEPGNAVPDDLPVSDFPRLEAGALLALFASVREEEEDSLMPVLKALYAKDFQGRHLTLALAPRHLHRLPAWRDRLDAAGMRWRLRSENAVPVADKGAILLQDRFGEMRQLYDLADAAFVGGSLAPLGGQNFLEALAQGLRPFVGPHTDNFAWVGEELFEEGLVRRVPDAQGLLASLDDELAHCAHNSYADRTAVRERFRLFLASRLGGSDLAARAVAKVL